MRLRSISKQQISGVNPEENFGESIELMMLSSEVDTMHSDLALIDAANYYADKYGEDNPIIQDIFGNILNVGTEGVMESIKGFFVKIYEMIKKVVMSIVNFFKKLFGFGKEDKEVKEKLLAAPTEDAKVKVLQEGIDKDFNELRRVIITPPPHPDKGEGNHQEPTGSKEMTAKEMLEKIEKARSIAKKIAAVASEKEKQGLQASYDEAFKEVRGLTAKQNIGNTRLNVANIVLLIRNVDKKTKIDTRAMHMYSMFIMAILKQSPSSMDMSKIETTSPEQIANHYVSTSIVMNTASKLTVSDVKKAEQVLKVMGNDVQKAQKLPDTVKLSNFSKGISAAAKLLQLVNYCVGKLASSVWTGKISSKEEIGKTLTAKVNAIVAPLKA